MKLLQQRGAEPARPNPSLEATSTGRAAWPFPGQRWYCPVQGQSALPVAAPQLKR